VLIRDGLIAAVGPDLEAPEGAEQIDATGLHLMPGIVDCHSHIATEGGLNESTVSISADVRVADALDPSDVELYRAAAAGVTAANILHGSANAIGGQNAVIRMKYRARPADLLFPGAPPGIKFALGENPKQSNFPANRGKRFPNSRMGVASVYPRAFEEARAYEQALRTDPLTRRDLRLDALVGVLQGEIRVHCHCYRSEEITMILDTARRHGFRIATLQHVLEGYRVMPEILASGAGASTFSDWWAYKIEAYEAIPHNAAMMEQAGIVTSINSDLPHQIRHLTIEAAKAMKYGGLSGTQAMALITINPARQLGIDGFVGSVEAGKRADLALYNGHPLSPYTRCVLTLIDGTVVFDGRETPRNGDPAYRPERQPRRAPGPLPEGGLVVLRGGLVHPVSSPPFTGNLVVRDGKIEALGPEVAVPPGAQVLDATGLRIYPGLIDAHTALGLTEIGSVAGTRDDAEIGLIQPDLVALRSVHPHSEMIPVTRANGITTALTRPLSGLIAGQSSVIRLDGWTPAEMSVVETAALHVDLPSEPEKPEGDAKKEFDARLKRAREAFQAARLLGPEGGADPKRRALLPYLKGERPVVFQASRARDIRAALKFAEEFGLKPVISGGEEAWKVAEELYQAKAPVILGGTLGIPLNGHDPADAVASNAAKLARAGVRFAISSNESAHGNTRNTPYHAAWASAHGLDREEALKSVTIRPAEILGIDGRTGSLEPGKDADLIVTTGDPLEVLTDVVWMFIAGRPVSLESKHTRLYEKFKDRKPR
jgi:imidazolonepropionase-like amidohydrolase